MIFCIETDGFSKCHISFLGCNVPKNEMGESGILASLLRGGNLPLKITLESPPVFQKMGDGLNLPKPVLNTENPRLFTRCFLGFEGDVLRIRSHGKSQCFTTIWENICLLFLSIEESQIPWFSMGQTRFGIPCLPLAFAFHPSSRTSSSATIWVFR